MLIAEDQRLSPGCSRFADLDAMAGVFRDLEVMRFGPSSQSRDWVRTWLRGCLEDY